MATPRTNHSQRPPLCSRRPARRPNAGPPGLLALGNVLCSVPAPVSRIANSCQPRPACGRIGPRQTPRLALTRPRRGDTAFPFFVHLFLSSCIARPLSGRASLFQEARRQARRPAAAVEARRAPRNALRKTSQARAAPPTLPVVQMRHTEALHSPSDARSIEMPSYRPL